MLHTSLPQPLEQLPITIGVHHYSVLMCTQGTSAGLGCSATGVEGGGAVTGARQEGTDGRRGAWGAVWR